MSESNSIPMQQPVNPATICSACDNPLGTERPLITLLCHCKAHTDCFLRDYGTKKHTDLPENCPRCQTPYVTEQIRDEIYQMAAAIEIEAENINREMNSCFALNEGSPEFVTDIAKCKEVVKEIKKHQKEYNRLVTTVVKKYKEDTKQMAAILKSARNDALLKIKAASCTKAYHNSVGRFCTFVSRMALRYEFTHGEWMRFTRRFYPSLYRSYFRYGHYDWRLRRKFRYGI